MTRTDRALCWAYGLIALAALVGTQWALLDFLRTDGNDGVTGFLDDIVAGPAVTFTTVDLLAVALAAVVFMVVEGRRIGLPWLWAYVAVVFLVAVSVAFPLFLIARTRHLATRRTAEPAPA